MKISNKSMNLSRIDFKFNKCYWISISLRPEVVHILVACIDELWMVLIVVIGFGKIRVANRESTLNGTFWWKERERSSPDEIFFGNSECWTGQQTSNMQLEFLCCITPIIQTLPIASKTHYMFATWWQWEYPCVVDFTLGRLKWVSTSKISLLLLEVHILNHFSSLRRFIYSILTY